jgi:hypothetical protein
VRAIEAQVKLKSGHALQKEGHGREGTVAANCEAGPGPGLVHQGRAVRSALNGTQFWSAASNDCSVPGCRSTGVTVTVPLTVTVVDPSGTAQAGLPLYVFDGTNYTGYSRTTDTNGQAVFMLPAGNCRFRADQGGAQYWSNAVDDCTVPACTSAQESRQFRCWRASLVSSRATEQTSRPEPPALVSEWAR